VGVFSKENRDLLVRVWFRGKGGRESSDSRGGGIVRSNRGSPKTEFRRAGKPEGFYEKG